MKKAVLLLAVIVFLMPVYTSAQSVIGPEGDNLVWFLFLSGLIALIALVNSILRKKKIKINQILYRKKIQIGLEKDRVYFPDILKLTLKNSGGKDIDLDCPALIFSNFWIKRKFRIKGTNKYHFYPLYLTVGSMHNLDIDLNGFYRHDNKLKKYPKVKVAISDTKGNRLGSKTIYVRKNPV